MKKLFKSKATFLLAVILLVTVTVGATFAFIVAVTEPLRNLFVDANVSCTTTYDEENKTWTITNDGDVEAYIRVSVVPYLTDGSDKVFWDNPTYTVEYADGSKWTVIGDHGYHYYKIPLPAGDSIEFGTVNVDPAAGTGFDYTVNKVTVNAEAFQVGSAEALADAWNVTYTEGVGFAAVSVCSHSRSIVNMDGEYHKDYCTKCGIVYGFARHSLTNNTENTNNRDGTHSGTCACGYEVVGAEHTVAYTYIDGVTHTEFCTLCDWTQTVDCDYDTKPILDVWGSSTTHRHVCACGAGAASEEHALVYLDNLDGTHKYWCATCKYVKSTAEHTLVQDNEATTADTHTYKCSDCSYTETNSHDWERKLSAEGHWDVCLTCGYETAITDHDLSEYTDDQNGTTHTVKCSACEYSEPANHNLVGTSVSDTEHTATCSDGCGYSENLTHNYAYSINAEDELYHTVTCSLAGCTYENTTAPHEWEYDTIEIALFNAGGNVNTEYHIARCKQCRYETEMEHSFTYERIDEGSHRVTCEACQYSTHETHKFSVFVKNDGTHHTYKCLHCEQTREQEHDITWVTDATGHIAKCNTCGFTGEWTEHRYSDYVDDQNDISHTATCLDCGYKKQVGHDAFTYDYTEANHTAICNTCGYSKTAGHDTFTYEYTDANHTAKCSTCGYRKDSENHTKVYTNLAASGHSWTCSVCKHSVTERHDGNTTCVCGYVTLQYEKQFPILSEDMQPLLADNNGYVWEESVLFIDGVSETKTLLYPISQIIEVKYVNTETGEITYYEKDKHFTVADGKITMIPGSGIKSMPEATWNDWASSPGGAAGNDLAGGKYWGEDDAMSKYQVRITYTYDPAGAWGGAEQTSYYHLQYAEFIQKLRDGKDVTVLFFGDSITWGANASYNIGKNPDDGYSYSILLTQALADLFDYKIDYIQTNLVTGDQQPVKVPSTNYIPSSGGSRGTIKYINTSVGGWSSADAANNLASHLCDWTNTYGCDLLVVAFGMNDLWIPPSDTASNVYTIGQHVKEKIYDWLTPIPDAAVMLVSTMIPNPDSWIGALDTNGQMEALRGVAAKWRNSAVVDMTSISRAIYNQKGLFADYSGNNVNHPNDFLHRIYAQTLLEALIGYENIANMQTEVVYKNGNLDAHTINGVDQNPGESISVAGWDTIGLRGWVGYNKPIAYYGYKIDNGIAYWTANSGMAPNQAEDQSVINAGGEHAKRFHIQVSMYWLDAGGHTVEFFVMLSDGSIQSLGTLTPNITIVPNIDILIFHATPTNHSTDGFTTNGNAHVLYSVPEWHASRTDPKLLTISRDNTAGLYGWLALYSPVVKVGYCWDTLTNGIIWQDGLGVGTTQDVIDAGGATARRFHINADISTAPTLGCHLLNYVVQLEDGRIITHEGWYVNVVE